MEGIDALGGLLVVARRLALAAERLVRAGEPVVAARGARGAVGIFARGLEVRDRGLGVLEVAQRDPAGEERRILERIDGHRAGRLGQRIGLLVGTRTKELVDRPASVQPPGIGIDESIGIGRRQLEKTRDLLLLALAAGELDALKEQSPIGRGILGGRREPGHEFRGIAGACVDGDACFGRFALWRRELRQQAACGGDPRRALGGEPAFVDQENVEPAAMVDGARESARSE